MEASDALKGHALSKLEKLYKYLVKPETVHIIFNVERFVHIAEVTLHANGVPYVSHEKAPDIYAAIDGAVAKLERQLKKYKEKLKKHKNKIRTRRSMPPP